MPAAVLTFFKGLSPAAHLQWLLVLLLFPIIDVFNGPPDMTDRPLARSEGRIVAVDGRKGGYDVELQPDEHVRQYARVFIAQARATILDAQSIQTGQYIRAERYGNQVGNCWIGARQVCVAKCSSDLQCKQHQVDGERWVKPWAMGLTLFGYFFTLIWVACGGQIGARRKDRGVDR